MGSPILVRWHLYTEPTPRSNITNSSDMDPCYDMHTGWGAHHEQIICSCSHNHTSNEMFYDQYVNMVISMAGCRNEKKRKLCYQFPFQRSCFVMIVWKDETPVCGFNIKMPSYQHSHCADKTILRPSHLHNRISYIQLRWHFYIESGPW